jgi:hypothetical protein
MKFTGSIDIHKPLAEVTGLFADPNNLHHWQDGFVNKILLSGEAGVEGAVSKMYYSMGKRKMELTETVIDNQLPHSFKAHYHHVHMDNTMKCTFTAIDESTTRYETEVEYTRINWVIPKLMAILFPGMYRKQGEKWMKNFKTFVEAS